MKLTSMFMSLLVLSMTVEGFFFDCPCRGTCFSSPISNYILTFATGNYTEAIGRCSELGPGWEITRLNDDNELDFIQDVTRDLYSRRRRFWIGGSTDVEVGERVTYENYNTTDCEINRVAMVMDRVQLISSEPSESALLVLCKQSRNQPTGLTYSSITSDYQKLVATTSHDLSYWTQQCTELGKEWHPAVMNNRQEEVLMYRAQFWFSDKRDYWLGGYSSIIDNWCDLFEEDAFLVAKTGTIGPVRSSHSEFGIICE